MKRALAAVAVLAATLPGVAAAQQPQPQRPAQAQQQRQAQPPPAPPNPAEQRRQFCDHAGEEVETLISSLNAAFRGRQAAQRDLARLAGRADADEARRRAEHWRRMIDELSNDLQKWALVRAGLGCPSYAP